MEENHRELTQSSNHSGEGNNEIIMEMMPVESNRRKLYEAAKMGSVQSLNTLIQDDPNVIRKVLISNSNIKTPLHVSVSRGHLEFTRLLLDQNPELATELDALQRTPLHLASISERVEIVQALLEKNTNACLTRDLDGLIPLHYAVISGQIEIMQELIKARPQSVWMKLNNGQTVLHLCAKDNHLDAIKLLTEILKIHDDEEFLNTTDNSGNTVLDLSLMSRQTEIVRYLHSFPGIKTGTSIMTNCATSNAITRGSSGGCSTHRIKDVPSASEEHSGESYASAAKRKVKRWWEKHLKYKGDWVQDVQGTMMLVATVIASATFQGAINPPGGVWQEDGDHNKPRIIGTEVTANSPSTYFPGSAIPGTAVMAYGRFYNRYLIANMISFFASICVVLLIIGRLPLKNRICAWLLTLTMCISVIAFAYSYMMGIMTVNLIYESPVLRVALSTEISIWIAMIIVVLLSCIMIPFIVWVVKLLIWVVKCLIRVVKLSECYT